MAGGAAAQVRLEARTNQVTIEDAVRAALAGARPSLEEILSLWPLARRDRVVLWAELGADGAICVRATLREHVLRREPVDLARGVRRIRDDVPVVLGLAGVGQVVVPMRALREGGARG
jgi:hypothetical protein